MSTTVAWRTITGFLALMVGLALMGVGLVDHAQAQGGPDPVVEAARQVTQDPRPARTQPIPEIAVHPDEPETLVVVAPAARFGGCQLYLSRDGGLTWLLGNQDILTDPYDFCIRRPFGRTVDPVFTPDGERLYIGFGGADADGTDYPNGPTDALFASSDNLGMDVTTTVVAESGEVEASNDAGDTDMVREQHDMASVAVDPDDIDRVYRGWRRQTTAPSFTEREGFPTGVQSVDGLHTMVAISEDGGESWGEPIDLTVDVGGDDLTPDGSDVPVILTDDGGVVYAITRERRPSGEDPAQPTRMLLFKSTDRGENWEMSVIAEFETGVTTPDAAIDPDSGDLYVAYEVARPLEGGGGGEDAPTPNRIEFVTSSDDGETWSDPVDIIDPEAIEDVNQYFPGISVAPNGRIDVAWWDFRDDPFFSYGEEGAHDAGEQWAHIYYSYSLDGGRTWAANLRVTDRLIDVSTGVAFPGATRGPIGVASTDDAAYVTWQDTRNGDPVDANVDVYMTRVRMQADPSAGGATDGRDAVDMGLGAGGALALGGLVLLGMTRRGRDPVFDEG